MTELLLPGDGMERARTTFRSTSQMWWEWPLMGTAAFRCAATGRSSLGGKITSEQNWVPPGVTTPVQIAAGSAHSVALMADGSLVEWGFLSGLGVPTNLARCSAVAAGAYHNVALLSGGSVAAWGENFSG